MKDLESQLTTEGLVLQDGYEVAQPTLLTKAAIAAVSGGNDDPPKKEGDRPKFDLAFILDSPQEV